MKEEGKILVVDDVPQHRELLQAILNIEGYKVITSGNGNEALALVKREMPDIVLLDAYLPGKDGYEVCSQIKGDSSTRLIPIILLASFDELEERVKALTVGADDFLRKPISRIEVIARVRSLIATKRLNEELIDIEKVALALVSAVELKDPYALGHTQKVLTCALKLGARWGLSDKELKVLRKGIILHDVGKIGVREPILIA